MSPQRRKLHFAFKQPILKQPISNKVDFFIWGLEGGCEMHSVRNFREEPWSLSSFYWTPLDIALLCCFSQ